ncbi:diaminopimelate decarboxylase [Niabella terrae]
MAASLNNEQLLQIAGAFGSPLYVYNADKILEQFNRLQTAFSGTQKVRFFYASKALTNINILKLLKAAGCDVDCSSINEVKLALHAGFEPSRVLYTSNGIGFSEIQEAQALGVIINIDSLSNLEKFGKAYGGSYPVGVRLRPNIMAGGHLKIATGHDKSKFGIPVDQLEELLAIVAEYQMQITNLHVHTGSDIKDPEVFIQGIQVLFELLDRFPDLKSVDLGGGFKVAYRDDDAAIDVEALAARVLQTFAAHERARHLEIWFEPGKFLVSESGYFITQVNVLKHTSNVNFAGVNSGFNHLIRPMFYDAYHRIRNISNAEAPLREYAVTGNICETDNFAWGRSLPEIREGDYLVFENAGAYGFEMSSRYNSRFRPAEVLVQNGQARLIRRRENFEDLLSGQVLDDPR